MTAGESPRASIRDVEDRTRAWLEESFLRGVAAASQDGDPANEPWDDHGRPRRLTRYHFQEVLRKLKVFRWLDRLRFDSFIDVGSGLEGYPNLVRARYGVPAYFSDLVHSMNLPYGGAPYGRLDHAVTLNLESLPFRDGAFDVVLASEVLEHLVRPVEAIAELVRIARTAVVMTSLEALSPTRWARLLAHLRVDVRLPHVERNYFLPHEIAALFGPGARHENLLHDPTLPASGLAPAATQEAAYAGIGDATALVAALCRAARETAHGPETMGILIVRPGAGVRLPEPAREPDAALARWLVEQVGASHAASRRLLRQMVDGTAAFAERDRGIAEALRARLRCPDCRAGELVARGDALACIGCGTDFACEWGVPILYPTRPRPGDAALAEALDRLCGDDAGRRARVRRIATRLRRNERLPGRLRRAFWRVDALLRRATTPG